MNRVLLHDPSTRKWLRFDQPAKVVCATQLADIRAIMERVEDHVALGGWAAGFLTYEASPAFDSAMVVRNGGPAPLAWFGLFDQPTVLDELPPRPATYSVADWTPAISHADYLRAIAAIKEHIRVGDTYQVNFTFPLLADFHGDPEGLFRSLLTAQPAGYAALIETPSFAACSVSPELFFELKDGRVVSRPMKGTRRRGVNANDDIRLKEDLFNAPKDRAENLMIVDMIRNDMARVALPGTVAVTDLYAVEQHPTVLQMTSTVSGESTARWSDIMSALFPCASITGAPKIRTMEIIADLEQQSRGLYTGAIGFVAPGGFSRFSVAIRTVQIDLETGTARYDVGGGIVWDSDAEAEYDECRTKSAVLSKREPEFSLLETMRYEPGMGILFLERHLARLSASAKWFDFRLDIENIRQRLAAVSSLEANRIRLLVDRTGAATIEQTPMRGADDEPVTLTLARNAIDPRNKFVHHKTTNRAVYDELVEVGFDDIILFTPEGLVTETSRANLVLRFGGRLLTPDLSTGLLPGILRADFLDRGLIEEAMISIDDLKRADELFVLSALRGLRRATLATRASTPFPASQLLQPAR